MRSWAGWLLVSIVIIVLDQVSKHWITHSFQYGDSLTITSFFNLMLIYNTGAAFSLLASAPGWQRGLFIGIALVASVVIVYLLRRNASNVLFSFALSLVLGGALGNLVDRVMLGHVVDFLDFHYGGHHWPAFNVADMAITGGAVLLVWDSLKKPAVKR
jgi:signal peptidase II